MVLLPLDDRTTSANAKERSANDDNRQVFNSHAIVDTYAGADASDLLGVERAIVTRLGDRIRGKSLLDLGVGGGRTSPFFAGICGHYVGVDYAERMVLRCRQRFPHLQFRQGDATNLSEFPASSFDVIWFSYNGIDCSGPEGRIRILQEAHRLLRRGTLVFSSHNLEAPVTRPGFRPTLRWFWNPWLLLRRNVGEIKNRLLALYYYWRNRRRQVSGDGYAMVVDEAHDYRLLTYYVTARQQRRQLEALGFGAIEVIAMDGRVVEPESTTADPWIHFVARKGEAE